MNSFDLEILESDGYFYRGKSTHLTLPVEDGEMGIEAMHENLVMSVVPGIIHFTDEAGEIRYASVGEGMVRVEENNVLLLVETAERPDEIDLNRAKMNEADAREELEMKKGLREYRIAEYNLKREIARIELWNKYGIKE